MEKVENSISHEFESAWKNLGKEEVNDVMNLGNAYKLFLDEGKTERRCVNSIVKEAESQGFKSLDSYIEKGQISVGDKVYSINNGKAIALVIIGKQSVKSGLRIIGSHLDSPRLDLKPFPLYEDGGLALMKTHYYGGIKKYQWASIPLALYGVVILKDGRKVEISIGDEENDPVLFIPDLLIHLWKDQAGKKMSEGISAEELNIVVGNIPVEDKEEKNKVKLGVLKILNEKYGMTEKDFMTAELEAVPAGKARDVGLDRSMIAGYGHDDRVCAFASLDSICGIKVPEITSVALFTDKEEVGSNGNTGAESAFFENMMAEIINLQEGTYNELFLKRSLANSKVLSADITAAFDPTYASAYDKKNSAVFGRGAVMVKYTGSRGKYDCNDANAEYIGWLRKVLDDKNIVWQIGEMGKVDQGGGGTIAYMLANKGAQVVDFGLGALSVHAPQELVSKVDIYMMKKAYSAFYEAD